MKPALRLTRTRRIFLLALLASLLAHWLVLAGAGWSLPTDNITDTLIQVRLMPLPKAQPNIAPKPKVQPGSTPKASTQRKSESKPKPKPKPRHTTPIQPTEPLPEPVIATPDTAPASPAAPLLDAPQAETANETPTPPLNPMPGKATLDYDMLLGADGVRVGKTRYIWQTSDNRYSLTGITEGTGLVALVQPGKLVQISQGHITASGLAPDDYWIQRGKPTPDKTTAAHFNYGLKIVTIGKMAAATSVPLLENAQDVLSVTFQLAQIVPFDGEKLLYVTAGKGLKPYRVHVVGEEMLDTALGTLRTLHVSRVQEGEEDPIDVWLASDYNYLPVKVRVKHSKYGIVEQVIRAMTVAQ